MTQNGNIFNWWPIHQRCFDMIKVTCNKTPVLQPIDPQRNEPIWIICDASKSGVGAMYRQEQLWQTCRLAGFISKKFTSAQHNYRVHELETLAILEALMKWEDKLVGYRIHVITDHKALEFFKTQSNLMRRQMIWMDYLSRFDFDITYIKGENNKVADCLSQYYENDEEADVPPAQEYVCADARINLAGEDLPPDRFVKVMGSTIEIRAMQEEEHRRSWRLQEKLEMRDVKAQELAASAKETSPPPESLPDTQEDAEVDITIEMVLRSSPHLGLVLPDDNGFTTSIKLGYTEDALFKIVLDSPAEHHQFSINDKGLIWMTSCTGSRVLCIPRTKHGDQSLQGIILDQAHRTLGHYGFQCTSEYVCQMTVRNSIIYGWWCAI
ncbi:uncharacterized protein ARMOST_08601 [Armillaria ostoyae]|uniref:Reverse transcriptase RNase H-like domain-containing protein n=1 Tax=Armillaria ostoyae TaxID=47428 RepID=A0A284R941_ARMOS|nr:uncharacterized protein ARMOST_08601 [Armillaria ostoyae]